MAVWVWKGGQCIGGSPSGCVAGGELWLLPLPSIMRGDHPGKDPKSKFKVTLLLNVCRLCTFVKSKNRKSKLGRAFCPSASVRFALTSKTLLSKNAIPAAVFRSPLWSISHRVKLVTHHCKQMSIRHGSVYWVVPDLCVSALDGLLPSL